MSWNAPISGHLFQGQTAHRVLIPVDTELAAKDLLNCRMAYVSISRGAVDAQIFTNDREKLPTALSHDVSGQTAQAPRSIGSRQLRHSRTYHGGGCRSTASVLESAFRTLPASDNGTVARAQTLSRPTEGRRYRGHAP